LIDSIIKHFNGNKSIEFGYELLNDDSRIRFYVRNTGSRIDDTQKNIITEALKEGHSPYQDSLGFGLDLVKKFVELLEGTFTVEINEAGILMICFSIPYRVSSENQ